MVIAGDADGVIHLQRGRVVHHGAVVGQHVVIQQQGTGTKDEIGFGGGNGADSVEPIKAGQHAHGVIAAVNFQRDRATGFNNALHHIGVSQRHVSAGIAIIDVAVNIERVGLAAYHAVIHNGHGIRRGIEINQVNT